MDHAAIYYDPIKNKIYEGVYHDYREYFLFSDSGFLNITNTWIPAYFVYLGDL